MIWGNIRGKKLKYKFLRQRPIYLYTDNNWFNRFIIPDFYCSELKLCLEIDWNIHNKKEIYLLDREKEKILFSSWYKVIRFTNNEILNNIDWVLKDLENKINS
jgi:very-short-patch-repair endonuclease